MLWMALYFPALPLEVFSPVDQRDLAFAISQQTHGRELITRCNEQALQLGIRPGLPIPAAHALAPQLKIRRRNPEKEAEALQTLALWAHQFSSRICFEPLVLLLEVGSSLRLFGGLEPLQQQLIAGLKDLQHQAQTAIAPTPMAAALLSRCNPGQTALTQKSLLQLTQQIPLTQLTRDKKARDLINHIGLQTIGDCLALPRAELARRTQPRFTQLFDQLLGHRSDPRPLWQAPDTFSQRLELAAEIEHQHALIFPARRLITALCGYLRGRGAGTQHLSWQLEHRERAPTDFEQGLALPAREADHMLDMFRERIEHLQLAEPVVAIRLQIDHWSEFEEQTLTLLEQQKSRAEATLLERLCNRLGKQQVQGICSVADYRPECAWRFCPPGSEGSPHNGNQRHPLWLLEHPLELDASQGLPTYGGPLDLHSSAERVETGWWDDADVTRDYYIARNLLGERLWIFCDRRTRNWFLQGRFD